MLYRTNPRNGDELSQLGFGCMRFPKRGGQIDAENATRLVKAAIASGINYFDTAYIYPGSEQTLGLILEKEGLRDKVKIATKLPLFMCKANSDFDKFFNKQLERLRTNRIDYYLLHMLGDEKALDRLKALGIAEWIQNKKAEGKIINIGFSFHGGGHSFKNIIDAYNWDFCMIQYNYVDVKNQAGREGLQYASRKGLPVFVMEPLRGGTLVKGIPEEAREIFEKADKKRSLAEWALRWVWNQGEVTLLLSGMEDIGQIKENAALANVSPPGNLNDSEYAVYAGVLGIINKKTKIPCTGCAYCMPCPKGADIPTCLSCYNESYTQGYFTGMKRYFMTTGMISAKQTDAGKCAKCKECEARCPQGIEISSHMSKVDGRFGGAFVRGIMSIVRKFMKLKA